MVFLTDPTNEKDMIVFPNHLLLSTEIVYQEKSNRGGQVSSIPTDNHKVLDGDASENDPQLLNVPKVHNPKHVDQVDSSFSALDKQSFLERQCNFQHPPVLATLPMRPGSPMSSSSASSSASSLEDFDYFDQGQTMGAACPQWDSSVGINRAPWGAPIDEESDKDAFYFFIPPSTSASPNASRGDDVESSDSVDYFDDLLVDGDDEDVIPAPPLASVDIYTDNDRHAEGPALANHQGDANNASRLLQRQTQFTFKTGLDTIFEEADDGNTLCSLIDEDPIVGIDQRVPSSSSLGNSMKSKPSVESFQEIDGNLRLDSSLLNSDIRERRDILGSRLEEGNRVSFQDLSPAQLAAMNCIRALAFCL